MQHWVITYETHMVRVKVSKKPSQHNLIHATLDILFHRFAIAYRRETTY